MAKHLESLQIKNFRMLEDFSVEKLGDVNLIVGKNNSGKSTVLEALLIYATKANYGALRHLASSRDESFSYDGKNAVSSKEEISFSGFFSKFFMEGCSSFEIGDGSKKLSILYFNFLVKSEENRLLSEKYSHIINENKFFFKKNSPWVFLASDESEKKYRSINVAFDDEEFPSFHDSGLFVEFPCAVVETTFESKDADNIALSWDKILKERKEQVVYDVLRVIVPSLVDVVFVESNNKQQRVPYIGINDQIDRVPIKSQGYGASRLLEIGILINRAKDGFLLVDEFENGLHYSVQEKVWQMIFKMSKKLNIQVFATTHSRDCIEAFTQVANNCTDVEGVLFRMGRSAKASDNGKIIATVFDEAKLDRMTKSDMEIR